jgi:hypothetical protein
VWPHTGGFGLHSHLTSARAYSRNTPPPLTPDREWRCHLSVVLNAFAPLSELDRFDVETWCKSLWCAASCVNPSEQDLIVIVTLLTSVLGHHGAAHMRALRLSHEQEESPDDAPAHTHWREAL